MPNYSVMQLVTDTEDPTTAKMTIYGDIARDSIWTILTGEPDEGTTKALDVVDALSALPATARAVEVHINSYGGDVAEGVAIYNALRDCGRDVTTVCDGFACSIASVVFMAGKRRVMRPASLLMLHNPLYQRVGGNSKQLRKAADDLDVIAELSKTAYLTGTSIDAETLDAVMDAETWVSPQQALEWGLATEIEDAGDAEDEPTQAVGEAIAYALTDGGGELTAIAEGIAELSRRFEECGQLARDVYQPVIDAFAPKHLEQGQEPTSEPATEQAQGQEPEQAPGKPQDPEPEQQPEQKHGFARLADLMGRIDN